MNVERIPVRLRAILMLILMALFFIPVTVFGLSYKFKTTFKYRVKHFKDISVEMLQVLWRGYVE